jgi:radical SAM protein with 4Fe4S-binding SPASM domain
MKTSEYIYPNNMIIVHTKPYRLIDVKTGSIYPINDTSEKVLKQIKTKATIDGIVKELGFEDNSSNKHNLIDFLDKLMKANILTSNKDLAGKIFFKQSPTEFSLEKIQFETTLRCNFNCKHCYNKSDSSGYEMDTDSVISLVEKAQRMGVFKFDLTGGEYFTRTDAIYILDVMSEYGMALNIFSNAYLINDKILQKINEMANIRTFYISLDDCNPDFHDEMRNKKGSFNKTVESIRNLKEIGKQVVINCTVTQNTISHMQEIYDYFIYNLDVKCRMAPLINIGRGKDMDSINVEEFVHNIRSMGLKPEEDESMFKNSKQDIYSTKCGIGESMLFVAADGTILPCPLLRDDRFNLGNIIEDDFMNIWSNNSLLEEIRNSDCNPSCRYKTKCKGGCKSRAYLSSGHFDSIDPVTCSLFIE